MTRDQARALLLDYLYGEIGPEERALLEELLRTDPELQAEMQKLKAVREIAAGLGRARLSGEVERKILDAARKNAPSRVHGPLERVFYGPAFAGAVALLLALWGGYLWFSSRDRSVRRIPGEQARVASLRQEGSTGLPRVPGLPESQVAREEEAARGTGEHESLVPTHREAHPKAVATTARQRHPVRKREALTLRRSRTTQMAARPRALAGLEEEAAAGRKVHRARPARQRLATKKAAPVEHAPPSRSSRKPAARSSKARVLVPGEVYLHRAREARDRGDVRQAIALYRKALASGLPHDRKLLATYELGLTLVRAERVSEARRVLGTLESMKGGADLARELKTLILREEGRQRMSE